MGVQPQCHITVTVNMIDPFSLQTYSSHWGRIAIEFVDPISVPDPPTALLRDEVSTNKLQIALSWTPPEDNGGSEVLDYRVYIDDAEGNKIDEIEGVTSTSHIETGVTGGASYSYYVRARNSAGLSEFSLPLLIVAATEPSQPDAPTLIVISEYEIGISWTDPADDGGLPITAYMLEI